MLNFLGILSLIYLIIVLFIGDQAQPMSCLIAQAIVYSGEFSEVDPQYNIWIMILAKLLGFLTTICFMILGTYIVYYKAIVKVDTVL